jgi:hypothetical protein
MRNPNRLMLAAAIAVAIAAGCSGAGGTTIAVDGEWEPFTVDGIFSAELPGDPDGDEMSGAAGTLYAVQDGDREVGIAVADLPDGSSELSPDVIAGLLAQVNEAAATAVDGSVVSNEAVSGAAYPSQDAEFTLTRGGEEMIGLTRAVLVADRQFQLMAIGAVEDRADVEAIFERLVDGFEPAG